MLVAREVSVRNALKWPTPPTQAGLQCLESKKSGTGTSRTQQLAAAAAAALREILYYALQQSQTALGALLQPWSSAALGCWPLLWVASQLQPPEICSPPAGCWRVRFCTASWESCMRCSAPDACRAVVQLTTGCLMCSARRVAGPCLLQASQVVSHHLHSRLTDGAHSVVPDQMTLKLPPCSRQSMTEARSSTRACQPWPLWMLVTCSSGDLRMQAANGASSRSSVRSRQGCSHRQGLAAALQHEPPRRQQPLPALPMQGECSVRRPPPGKVQAALGLPGSCGGRLAPGLWHGRGADLKPELPPCSMAGHLHGQVAG